MLCASIPMNVRFKLGGRQWEFATNAYWQIIVAQCRGGGAMGFYDFACINSFCQCISRGFMWIFIITKFVIVMVNVVLWPMCQFCKRHASKVLNCAKEWHKITHNHNLEQHGVFEWSTRSSSQQCGRASSTTYYKCKAQQSRSKTWGHTDGVV